MRRLTVVLCLAAVLLALGNSVYAGRYYEPQIARWATPDPALRDKLPNDLVKTQDGKLLSTSPYGYAFDNPLRYTDPDGKTPWDIIDIAAAALSIKDFIEKPTLTNALLAGADVIGAAVPVVPSFGTFRHGARLLGKVDDAMDLVKGAESATDVAKGIDKAIDVAKEGAKFERHHLLPQQFREQFTKAGLNIEEFTVNLPKELHRLKPGGLHTGSRNWNKQWRKFFQENPNATKSEILQHLEKMKNDFNLER